MYSALCMVQMRPSSFIVHIRGAELHKIHRRTRDCRGERRAAVRTHLTPDWYCQGIRAGRVWRWRAETREFDTARSAASHPPTPAPAGRAQAAQGRADRGLDLRGHGACVGARACAVNFSKRLFNFASILRFYSSILNI